MTMPMPTPVPTQIYTNVPALEPQPNERSPSAARFASFSTERFKPKATCNSVTMPCRPHSGRFDAKSTRLLCSAKTPGVPMTACTTCDQDRPASARLASACDTVGLESLVARASWARDVGLLLRKYSNSDRSLIARNNDGVPG